MYYHRCSDLTFFKPRYQQFSILISIFCSIFIISIKKEFLNFAFLYQNLFRLLTQSPYQGYIDSGQLSRSRNVTQSCFCLLWR